MAMTDEQYLEMKAKVDAKLAYNKAKRAYDDKVLAIVIAEANADRAKNPKEWDEMEVEIRGLFVLEEGEVAADFNDIDPVPYAAEDFGFPAFDPDLHSDPDFKPVRKGK